MYQNNFGQQQQQFQAQTNKYQPVGFVQSHYQGIPNARGSISALSNTGPVISHVGYTAAQTQPSQSWSGQTSAFTSSNAFGAGMSNASYQQPVLSHIGQTAAGQNFNQYQSAGQVNAQTSYQPVISHVGYTAGQDFARNQVSQFGAQQQQWQQPQQFATSNFSQTAAHAVTPLNPIYQASNQAQNAGPVLSRVGYSTPSQSQAGFQSQMGSSWSSAGRF